MATDTNIEGAEVALVADPAFSDKLVDLADRLHVRVIDTPANHTAAELARKGFVADAAPCERGITDVPCGRRSTPEETVVAVSATIRNSPRGNSHDPPWSVLASVYGTRRCN